MISSRRLSLSPLPPPLAIPPAPSADTLGSSLLRDGLIQPEDLFEALSFRNRRGGRLLDLLISRGHSPAPVLLAATARHFGVERVDPCHPLPDPSLIDRIGAQDCLRLGLVPWRRVGAATVVVTSRPEEFARLQPELELRLGPVLMAIAAATEVEAAVLARRGPRLSRQAEERVADAESCRDWGNPVAVRRGIAAGLAVLLLLAVAPLALFGALFAAAMVSLVLATLLKVLAIRAALLPRTPPRSLALSPPAALPSVSIIVALYHESDIAPRLVRRLSRLDYPRELLEIVLAVEADDRATRAALASASLPPWMRIVLVPAGRVKTKPRALNFALDHCQGSIVGIYDAEDAPEPDQIRKVVARFGQVDHRVACLQGVLDYYNPHTNWLSRCFTVEYASWFRLMLPGIQRLGLVVPLGGTTLFFRRDVLEELGGWDAHNVTEDADLGVRLARHGYRTEVIATVTREEANCRVVPWIKQRSRWIKGYMMTWAVHMRDPLLLWRQLGPRAFLGFQVMFLGSILQFLLAPLLWSFWLVPLGLPHPLQQVMPPGLMMAVTLCFLGSEGVNIGMGLLALRRRGGGLTPLWVPTLHFYFPFAALAAYKALWELVTRPFYWDKTRHGAFAAFPLRT